MRSPDFQLDVLVASLSIPSPMNTKIHKNVAGNWHELLATDPLLFKSFMLQK
jgi:hypothetical protein